MLPRSLVIAFSFLPLTAFAATFVVDSSSDLNLSACVDAVPDDCSLRGAINAANQTTAPDAVHFNLPPSDPGYQSATAHWRIVVGATALPGIEAPLVIDGYTQPGAFANSNTPDQGGLNGVLKIEVRGADPTGNQGNGFDFGNAQSLSGSVFRGLVINNFRGGMILLQGPVAHRVEGCYLGTDVTGSSAGQATLSNAGSGLVLAGPGAFVIGGVLPAQRNLISGLRNAVFALRDADGLSIQGNLIGTNAAGTVAVANDSGLSLGRMTNSQIGGTSSAMRNVISASRFNALYLFAGGSGGYAGTRIEGNFFGTDVSGGRRLGNGFSSASATIYAFGAGCQLTLGGTAAGAANLIAFGEGDGIENDRCFGLETRFNRFYANRGIPLDNVSGGAFVGADANDLNDADDGGGNRLQNFPEISVLNVSGNSANLQIRVDTALTNASYPLTLNLYRGACGGGSDALLASTSISAAQAQQPIQFALTSPDGGPVFPLTATAVDAAGNTSEFAPMLGDLIYRTDFEAAVAPITPTICR